EGGVDHDALDLDHLADVAVSAVRTRLVRHGSPGEAFPGDGARRGGAGGARRVYPRAGAVDPSGRTAGRRARRPPGPRGRALRRTRRRGPGTPFERTAPRYGVELRCVPSTSRISPT